MPLAAIPTTTSRRVSLAFAQIARAIRGRIFGAFHRVTQRSFAAGDDGLHHARRRAERRRAFGGVENGEPAAGSRADVEKPSAFAKRLHDGIHRARNFRQLAANSGGDVRVLTVQDAQNFDASISGRGRANADSAARF